MSGSSAAYHLVKNGKSVVIVEAREISGGATGRNGGFLKPVNWNQLPVLLRSRGILESIELIKLEVEGRQQVRQFCNDHHIECDLDKDIDTMEFFDGHAGLKETLSWWYGLRHILLPLAGVKTLDDRNAIRAHLPLLRDDTDFNCGIVDRASGDTFWAAKFTKAVAKEALKAGAHICTDTSVTGWEPISPEDLSHNKVINPNARIRVFTSRGTIECNHCVFATNAHTADLVPDMKGKIIPVRNHVLCTAPAPPLAVGADGTPRRVGISCQNGFIYFMQRPDGRIIIGGFRNHEKGHGVDVADDGKIDPEVLAYAKGFLGRQFKGFEIENVPVEAAWTGIIGWSCDNRPWCGPLWTNPNVSVCAGFSGHGMTQCFLCGKAVAEMVAGRRPSPFVSTFLPREGRTSTADLHLGHWE